MTEATLIGKQVSITWIDRRHFIAQPRFAVMDVQAPMIKLRYRRYGSLVDTWFNMNLIESMEEVETEALGFMPEDYKG